MKKLKFTRRSIQKGITHRYIIIIVILRADKTIYTETIKKIDIKIIKEKNHVKDLSVNHVKDPSDSLH